MKFAHIHQNCLKLKKEDVRFVLSLERHISDSFDDRLRLDMKHVQLVVFS